MSRDPTAPTPEEDMIPRREVDEIIRQLNEDMDRRVTARTRELRTANERLLLEMDERVAAEERLRESEELYRYTLELSEQLVWTASPEGRMLSASDGFARITGLSPDADPHECWLATLHPDDLERATTNWRRAVAAGQLHSGEFRLRMKDGTYRTFRSRAAPRRDEEGRVIRWYGYTEDVEERRISTAARARAEELYRLAARATNDAIWDLDILTNEIHWSDSASETLGYPGRRLGTTSFDWWKDRVHPDDQITAVATLDDAIDHGKFRWSATYRFRRANGDYGIFFDRGFIVHDDDGKAIRAVGAMTDFTERQRADQELRRMQSELIHVSRLSAMGTMASTLAHELNQPLTAVANYLRGSLRLLENEAGPAIAEVRRALEAAESGALTAGHIVRRTRDLVARGNSTTRPSELAKLIESAGALAFLDEHLMGVSHKVDLDPETLWVEVDRIQIQQVLINLIRNAIQAMQDQPKREIEIRTRTVSPHQVQVSVADTGAGISPKVRHALFTPFQGTKADGLGIGLSISRTIIEAHGGKIWAEDRDGGGTIFAFTLPRHDPPAEK
ncbi:MAG: PAS domain-containing protein [Sphingosinicella sp.]|nr:PAS domain-containing protein [Sphingosinicella sp.]